MSIKERVHTGGNMEFVHTKKSRESVEGKHTKYTQDFVNSLRAHYASRKKYTRGDSNKVANSRQTPSKSSFRLFLILTTLILALIFIKVPGKNLIAVNQTEIVTETVELPGAISFSHFYEDPQNFYNEEVIVKGYLMRFLEGDDNSGVYIESIKDDEGNYIKLTRMRKDLLPLFPKVGETDDLYKVSGEFKRVYQGFVIEVISISPTKRDSAGTRSVEVERVYSQLVENKTQVPIWRFALGFLNGQLNISNIANESQIKDTFMSLKKKSGGLAKSVTETSKEVASTVVEELEEFGDRSFNRTHIESEIFRLVNEERLRVGVHPLVRNSYLDELASEHSDRMLSESFFEHSNHNVGENIMLTPVHYNVLGCGSTYTNAAQAKCIVDGWIDSPGHYRNMIDYGYVSTGIGVSCNLVECKSTQNFR